MVSDVVPYTSPGSDKSLVNTVPVGHAFWFRSDLLVPGMRWWLRLLAVAANAKSLLGICSVVVAEAWIDTNVVYPLPL